MDNTGFAPEQLIPVQICYAEPEKQIILDIKVPANTRLVDAIFQSGIMDQLSITVKEGEVGIFGKKKPFHTLLKAHDRIEIYRPLKISPQEARRQRARSPGEN